MEKEIVAIKSAAGNCFVIGKSDSGFYLKNKYTEIPNEFNMYSEDAIKDLFMGLCDRIPDCKKVDFTSGHPNSCMRVVYSDKTEQLFQEQKGVGLNLCAFTADTAHYSEFFTGYLGRGSSELITLEHLRWVCRDKSENYAVLLEAIKDYKEDDAIEIFDKILPDGTIEIHEEIFARDYGAIITILPDGRIEKTGNLKFVDLMKQFEVLVK